MSSFKNIGPAAACLASLIAAGPALAAVYYYDNNGSSSGFGSAGGTWGTSSVLTTNSGGTAPTSNPATTTGDTLYLGTDTFGLGAGTITVNGRSIGSIIRGSASSSGIITLQGSSITFAANGFVTNEATGQTLTISSTIAGGGTSMTFTNANITGNNTYSGATIMNGVHRIDGIANGGANSELGSSSSAAGNLVFQDGAVLRYDGGAGSTNRNFTVNGTAAGLYARGTGDLTWNGTVSFGTPDQAATLNLQNTGGVAGRGIFNGLLADNGTGRLSVTVTSFAAGGGWTLGGANTYTGDTTVNSGATLTLADNAELRFDIGADGVNNSILGTGTLTLEGDLVLDLTGASSTFGHSWSIVDVAGLAEVLFGGTFNVRSTLGSFSQSGDVWTISENGTSYRFEEATGVLSVVPEPASLGLAGAGLLLMASRRRRR